jgi:hypothetical protein
MHYSPAMATQDRIGAWQWVVLGTALALCSGCSRKSSAKSGSSRENRPQAAAPVAAASADPADKHGSRKLMGLDVPVYVDGVARSVLRSGDLPMMPEAKAWNGSSGFRVYDYLKAGGVAPESVRSIHFYANLDRIGSVEGSELRADKDRFVMTFSSGDSGSPLTRWHTDGLKNEYVTHEIRKMVVYVMKDVPKIDKERQCITAKGACTGAVPYVETELAKGTRIVVDGKIVGFVKRRLLTDATIVGKDKAGNANYSIAKFVAALGVDVADVTGIELLAGDDVIARAEGNEWSRLRESLYFMIPPHSHGKARFHVTSEIQAEGSGITEKDALVTAVLVHKSTKVSTRELTRISEDTDLSVQLARKDDQPHGE